MEAAEVEARVAASEEATAPQPVQAGPEMYTYSRWVHIGPHADECSEVDETNGRVECNNPLHFHVWVRLPNKLQREELENTGAAARARKLRELRDEESDARARLEAELEPLATGGEPAAMALDLLRDDWGKDWLKATAEVREEEEEKFKHLEQDKLRYQELYAEHGGKPFDDWPGELKELHQHIEGYLKLARDRLAVIQAPKKQALVEQGRDALVELLREKRVEEVGSLAYAAAYNRAEWVMCTFIAPGTAGGRTRKWSSVAHMSDEAPEVIDAIEGAFNELEAAFFAGVRGNS